MSGARRFMLVRIVPQSLALALSSVACAFDLNGAWATDPDQCSKVFERKGGGIVLSDTSDMHGSGFVIDGKKAIGKTARCTINSTKEEGTTISFLASCASEIMFQNIEFSLKIVNEDTVNRIFPGIPEMSITYSRCPTLMP